MSDIRNLPKSGAYANGKLIYQLVSASSLKDTDLFAISTSDNLTRKVTLTQIKKSFSNEFYNKDDIDILLDELRKEIKNINKYITDLENDITEFRNEFNNKLNQLRQEFNEDINNLDQKFTNLINDINQDINAITNRVDSLEQNFNAFKSQTESNITNINKRIDALDKEIDEKLNNLIAYGASVPSTLATGKLYLQYF